LTLCGILVIKRLLQMILIPEPEMPNDAPKTMSVPDAGAKYLGLSRNGSYDAAHRGEIPTIRIGKLLRVPVAQMEKKVAGEAVQVWSQDATDPRSSKDVEAA
jgi:excisionase family DNA binding protein